MGKIRDSHYYMIKHLYIFILISMPIFVFAQQTNTKNESTTPSAIYKLDKTLGIYKSPIKAELIYPSITAGVGLTSFHGAVKPSYGNHFAYGLSVYNVGFEQILSQKQAFGLRFMHGNLTTNSYTSNANYLVSLKSEITSTGGYFKYNIGNYSNSFKNKKRMLAPFVSVGLEIMHRSEPWGDISSNGQNYFQWSDGTIRDIEETPANVSSSNIIYRDYNFETNYARLNKKVESPISLAIPFEIGASFKFSKTYHLNIGYQYHQMLTNSLSSQTVESNIPQSKAVNSLDAYSYSYVSLTYNFNNSSRFNKKENINDDKTLHYFWDQDNDGLSETRDFCPYTPNGVEVNAEGCPIDKDADGVPDYIDKEANTYKKAFYVDQNGISVSETSILARMQDIHTVKQDEIYKYYPQLLNGGTVYKQFYKKIPLKFKVLDTNKDQYLDLNEMLLTIDSYFDDSIEPTNNQMPKLTAKDIFELIEFFFLQ